MLLPIQKVKAGVQFAATIQPKSSKNKITGVHNNTLKIHLTAAPVEGAANRACVKIIAKFLGIRISKVTIINGFSSRHKIIQVASLTKEKILDILQLGPNDSI